MCLDGADLFFQISKNQRSPPPKLSTVERNDSQYWRQSHERGKEREVHHSHWRFHRVRFEATAWTSEIFPFLTTAIKCREVSSIPSFRTWAKHPQFGLLWAPNKENLRVTVTLFGCMASVVTEHNFTAQISPVWLTLAFHLLKCNSMSSIYFHFRSEAIWFSSRFFWAKRKIGLSYDPVSQRIWTPLPNFPLKHRLYHIWWLILFASFLSMFFSITTQYSSIKVEKTAISFQFCRIY